MLKSTLFSTLVAAVVFGASGCCCMQNWLYQGQSCADGCTEGCGPGNYCDLFGRYGHAGALGGGCGDCGECDSCHGPVTRDACGGGFGRCFGLFDFFGWGCGDVYYGDHINVRPNRCKTCDQHGNWIGPGPGHHGATIYDSGPQMPIEYSEGQIVPYEVHTTPAQPEPTPARVTRKPRRAF